MAINGSMLRTATHQHGLNHAHRQDYFINDLFSIDGSIGIIRALDKCKSIQDDSERDRYIQAVIAWNGKPANKASARQMLAGYFYFIGVLTSSRTAMVFDACKLFGKYLAQLLTPFITKPVAVAFEPPSTPIAGTGLLPATESMLENVIGAHAPTVAESSPTAI